MTNTDGSQLKGNKKWKLYGCRLLVRLSCLNWNNWLNCGKGRRCVVLADPVNIAHDPMLTIPHLDPHPFQWNCGRFYRERTLWCPIRRPICRLLVSCIRNHPKLQAVNQSWIARKWKWNQVIEDGGEMCAESSCTIFQICSDLIKYNLLLILFCFGYTYTKKNCSWCHSIY